jgi:hypothetical protein
MNLTKKEEEIWNGQDDGKQGFGREGQNLKGLCEIV